jgi:NADH dehydrogenase
LDGQVVRAGNIVWAAGVTASPVAKALGVDTDRAGRIKVLPDLSVPGHPCVFAVGDLTTLVDKNGVAVPGVAQGAMQGGTHVAKLLGYDLAVGPRAPEQRESFAYHDKGNMATIGRSKAVAQIGKLEFGGLLAWLAWLGVHLLFLVGLRNRISVFMLWVYSYFTYQRGARIIMAQRRGLTRFPSGGSNFRPAFRNARTAARRRED